MRSSKEVIGFINRFTNQAASHRAGRGKLHWAAGKERFLKTEREWKRDIISKECIILDEFALLTGMESVYP